MGGPSKAGHASAAALWSSPLARALRPPMTDADGRGWDRIDDTWAHGPLRALGQNQDYIRGSPRSFTMTRLFTGGAAICTVRAEPRKL
jgi:hypothetical protein